MKQSVSSGMCGPCCSVVPIGISTASTPRSIARLDLGPRHPLDEVLGHASDLRPNVRHRAILGRHRAGRARWKARSRSTASSSGTRSRARASPSSRSTAPASATSTSRPRRRSSSKHFRVVDYDMRGYGQSDRPVQDYDMEVWADDLAGLLDALEIAEAHVHGTSMGGMIAIVFAGKYPERTTSVVINCAAAKLGMAGRLIFKNWIDIARMDPDGPGQPHPRRADRVAGALEGVPRDAGRRRRDRHDPADPARLEPDRGLHRRLPGDVRHGHPRLAAEDHLARARARRRRGPDDAVGPGPGRRRPGGDLRGHPGRREARDPRARTTRRSSTTRTSTTGS